MSRNDFFGIVLGVMLASILFRIAYAYKPTLIEPFVHLGASA